jgi:arsenite-transporting ATPase
MRTGFARRLLSLHDLGRQLDFGDHRTAPDGEGVLDGIAVGESNVSALASAFRGERLSDLVDELAKRGKGVVMTMGKGGVGKTTVAARIASELARRGFAVTLTTTDPAAHVEQAVRELSAGATGLRVTRIDPAHETRRYTAEVMSTAGNGLDAQGKALLEEDLRSPCTEEIAVFRAFAETVAEGEDRFVIIDTAPTGHTLLLLDAAESYHREVLKKPSGSPEAVQQLLPRLRDPSYTHVLLVTLPEATPIHEAMQLERDLARADIKAFAWVVNQSLTPLDVTDPVLRSRRAHEATHLRELADHSAHIVLEPRSVGSPQASHAPSHSALQNPRKGKPEIWAASTFCIR